jgi:hypothetical protein
MFAFKKDLTIIVSYFIFVFLTEQMIPQMLRNLSTKALDA